MKRKSDAADEVRSIMFPADAPEIDDEDPRHNLVGGGDSCQQIRRKIKT